MMTFYDETLSRLPDPSVRPDYYENVPFKRFMAWLIDITIVGIVSAIIVPFTAFTALFFFPVLLLVIGFLYRWFTLTGRSATWGMRMMAIEFRTNTGERFDSGNAFLHTLGYSLTITTGALQLVSIFLMLISDRKQGLTDHIMGSAAINRPL
jgi:uncharacterized RDD family membrane protein YckC